MSHPFELNIDQLKAIEFSIEDISDETAAKVSGGIVAGDNGCVVTDEKGRSENGGDFTSQALGEEGGYTTQSTKETGGDYDL